MKKKNTHSIKLFDILDNDIFTSEFISGIAGDRLLNHNEKIILKKLLDETGDDLYVKLLFFITHQIFSIDDSKKLWDEILLHKKKVSKILKRNIKISVATLDYLTNIKNEIKNPKLIGEAFITKIAEISSVDTLTKLYNRSYLFIKIKDELKRFKRYNTPFSLLLLDIDNFKAINDTMGHQKGDEILFEFADLLESSKRDLDICSRFGGEEFIVLLPHTDMDEALIIAERIREKIERKFSGNSGLTASIGISNCPKSSKTLKDIIKKADEALYRSKNLGKNRVSD
jgi:diguanylate cyclase (GGDEF)-like protein